MKRLVWGLLVVGLAACGGNSTGTVPDRANPCATPGAFYVVTVTEQAPYLSVQAPFFLKCQDRDQEPQPLGLGKRAQGSMKLHFPNAILRAPHILRRI
jgi:hypothetical protein